MLSVQKLFYKHTNIKIYLEEEWQGLQIRPLDLQQVQDGCVFTASVAAWCLWARHKAQYTSMAAVIITSVAYSLMGEVSVEISQIGWNII